MRWCVSLAGGSMLALGLVFLGCWGQSRLQDRSARPGAVDIQLLAFNDFHGSLEAPDAVVFDPAAEDAGTPAGGAGHLAALVERLRARAPDRTVVVAAGDIIGASPLASALFHDEPTIAVMNRLGLAFSSVGNHEFDRGAEELLRLQRGGCHPLEGCTFDAPFAGATFRYLAANVVDEAAGGTLLPGYALKTIAGVTIGFVGVTLAGTADLVAAPRVAGLGFLSEAGAVNALVPRMRREGAQAIVVLVHQGGFGPVHQEASGCNIHGDILPVVAALDPAVDVVISGHTHAAYVCPNVDGKLVTSAASHGRVVTEIWLTIDRERGVVLSRSAENRIVDRRGEEDAAARAIVERAVRGAAPVATRVVGRVAGAIGRGESQAGESALGDVVADAQLEATRGAPALAEVALMNPGGLRADLSSSAGPVTYGQAFAVQPFGNSLVTMTLTGTQLKTLLEAQWLAPGGARVLAVSRGFSYAYHAGAPAGSRVDPGSLRIGGETVDPSGRYRVTVNSFLAGGGDGFSILAEGTDRIAGPVDVDALAGHLRPTLDGPALEAPALDRLRREP